MHKKQNKWVNIGDQVVVTAGNEKGQAGKVIARTDKRVVVEGLNIRKKHVKQKEGVQKGIVEMEGPINATNVNICDDEGKPVKLKVKIAEDGNRQLIYLKDGKEVVYRDVKKKKN